MLTEHTLASCEFSETDILQIINSQDSNRAHGHDMINILVLTLCDSAISRPLNVIFKTCLNTRKFPSECKKGNAVLIHKKTCLNTPKFPSECKEGNAVLIHKKDGK